MANSVDPSRRTKRPAQAEPCERQKKRARFESTQSDMSDLSQEKRMIDVRQKFQSQIPVQLPSHTPKPNLRPGTIRKKENVPQSLPSTALNTPQVKLPSKSTLVYERSLQPARDRQTRSQPATRETLRIQMTPPEMPPELESIFAKLSPPILPAEGTLEYEMLRQSLRDRQAQKRPVEIPPEVLRVLVKLPHVTLPAESTKHELPR